MNLRSYNRIKNELGSDICLVAVSKGQPLEKILELYNLGHRDFGENFLQEMLEKKAQLPDDIKWHFLGNIQSNKLSKISDSSYLIHSVSRQKIYKLLLNSKPKESIRILLQLKLGLEETKAGLSENEILSIVKNHNKDSKVEIKGVMAISENNISNAELMAQFESAENFFKKLQLIDNRVEILSMGMSNDYREAISFNTNMVRLGTLIFGKRKIKNEG